MKSNARVYQNLPSIIADELREAILRGEIKAGQRLKQEEIAQRFESSLIPVREALRSLEKEGLVTFYPNKGAIVSQLSSEEVRQIFETRIILEQGALALSIPNLTETDIEEAMTYIELLDTVSAGKELSNYNKDFHNILYRHCNNKYLLDMIDSLHRNVERYMRPYLLNEYNNELSQTYHRKIVSAAKAKQINKAKDYLETHMEMAMCDLINALDKNKEE